MPFDLFFVSSNEYFTKQILYTRKYSPPPQYYFCLVRHRCQWGNLRLYLANSNVFNYFSLNTPMSGRQDGEGPFASEEWRKKTRILKQVKHTKLQFPTRYRKRSL